MSQVPLTLRRRVIELTLGVRDFALSLNRRNIALTLPDRSICGGATAANLARFVILQGLFPIDRKVFLLYGLTTDHYDDKPGSTLTLRRRKIALTLGG